MPSPAVYALKDGRVVPSPGQVLERATVLIRDGMIEAVGPDVTIPPDAVVVDCTGLNVYPGLIDARTSVLQPQAPAPPPGADADEGTPKPEAKPTSGYGDRLQVVRPEHRAADEMLVSDSELEKWRGVGFTTVLTVPRGKLFLGRSALIDLAGSAPGDLLVRPEVALHVAFQTDQGRYPASMMGAVAVIRQTLYDAGHYAQELARYRQLAGRRVRRPRFNAALEALQPAVNGEVPLIFDTPEWLDALRALRIAREFNLTPLLAGVRDAYRIVPQLRDSGASVILALNFPKAPEVGDDPNDAADADHDSLQDLQDRYHCPESAADLARAGVPFALTALGLDSPADFPKRVATVIERGLSRDTALAALTIVPARLLGVDSMLGTLTPGKVANVVVTEGELFDKKSKVRQIYVDGHKLDVEEKPAGADPDAKIQLAGAWDLTVESPQGTVPVTLRIRGTSGSYAGDALAMGMTVRFNQIDAEGNDVTLTGDGAAVGLSGEIVIHVIVTGESMTGSVSLPNGESSPVHGTRTSGPQEEAAP